jgi:hypothetical protein
MSGTHRHANPNEEADTARPNRNIFQPVHKSIAASGSIAISVHGFTPDYYGPPINTTDVILSDGCDRRGRWDPTPAAIELRNLLREGGWSTGLAAYDDGYLDLSGSINPQGLYSNDTFGHGRWIHVELARPIRDDQASWLGVTEIIRDWAIEIKERRRS